MSHVDPDLLALLALGEEAGDDADRAHVAECVECALEVENLRHAVTVGRSTLDTSDLLEPSPRVWAAIQEELGRETVAPVTPLRRRRFVAALAAVAAVAVVSPGAARSGRHCGPRRRRCSPRRRSTPSPPGRTPSARPSSSNGPTAPASSTSA